MLPRAPSKYNLDPATKACGSPEDLARDKDVDLVVCCTRVDKHYETILPSVKAGQNVLVKWPLANGLTGVEDLVEQAEKSPTERVARTDYCKLSRRFLVNDRYGRFYPRTKYVHLNSLAPQREPCGFPPNP